MDAEDSSGKNGAAYLDVSMEKDENVVGDNFQVGEQVWFMDDRSRVDEVLFSGEELIDPEETGVDGILLDPEETEVDPLDLAVGRRETKEKPTKMRKRRKKGKYV